MLGSRIFISSSAEATQRIGKCLAAHLRSGDVLTLDGDMGAGKTAFTRGLAQGLGHEEGVASPTFTIVMEHPAETKGQIALFHFDVYRLDGGDDFLDAGLDEYLNRDGICVIEWGKLVSDVLPEDRLCLSIHGSGEVRELVFHFPEDRADDLLSLSEDLSGDPEIKDLEGGSIC